LAQVGFAGLLISFLFFVISNAIEIYTWPIRMVGMLLGLMIIGIGGLAVLLAGKRSKTYVTDRRVVRFTAATLWGTASRTLAWDEVVKVKTYSPNFWFRLFNIGSVVVHARTTILPGVAEADTYQNVTNDDILMDGIEYFRDLGNYMDKVLYLYKKEPEQLKTIRSFVAKPRGKRY